MNWPGAERERTRREVSLGFLGVCSETCKTAGEGAGRILGDQERPPLYRLVPQFPPPPKSDARLPGPWQERAVGRYSVLGAEVGLLLPLLTGSRGRAGQLTRASASYFLRAP